MHAQPRTLRLASPFMRGPDVVEVQRLLGAEPDGVFGPQTAAAAQAWKRSRGDPTPAADLTPAERRRLLRDVPLRAIVLLERWAARGVREEPFGSNRVPELAVLAERLDVAAPLDQMGYPWCSFAAFLAALAAGGRAATLGLCRRSFNALYAPDVLAAAEAGRFGLHAVSDGEVWRGDLVLFDWDLTGGDPADHVARLAELPADGRVRTVDGNSGGLGSVAWRERADSSVRAFVRDS